MDLDTIHKDIEDLRRVVDKLVVSQTSDHEVLMHHDKILVRGNGTPSLQETVRALTRTVEEFILEVKAERMKREKAEEEEKTRKLTERTRWKWTIIGIGLPMLLTIVGQAIVFWIKFAPIIEQMSEGI